MANDLDGGRHWGGLVTLVGILCLLVAPFAPWPDAVDAWIWGGILVAAGLLMLRRRAPKVPPSPTSEDRE
jgi:hypothetical protein